MTTRSNSDDKDVEVLWISSAIHTWGRVINYHDALSCGKGFGAPKARRGYAASNLAICDI